MRAYDDRFRPLFDEIMRRQAAPPPAAVPSAVRDTAPDDPNWWKAAMGLGIGGRIIDALNQPEEREPVTIQAKGLSTENLTRLYAILDNRQQTDLAWKQQQQQRADAARRERTASERAERWRYEDRAQQSQRDQIEAAIRNAEAQQRHEEREADRQLRREAQESLQQYRNDTLEQRRIDREERARRAASGGGPSKPTFIDTVDAAGNPVKQAIRWDEASGQYVRVGDPFPLEPKRDAAPRLFTVTDENGNQAIVQAAPSDAGTPVVSAPVPTGGTEGRGKAVDAAASVRRMLDNPESDQFEGWTAADKRAYIEDLERQGAVPKGTAKYAFPAKVDQTVIEPKNVVLTPPERLAGDEQQPWWQKNPAPAVPAKSKASATAAEGTRRTTPDGKTWVRQGGKWVEER